jgi:GT2 family glycosyltransferase
MAKDAPPTQKFAENDFAGGSTAIPQLSICIVNWNCADCLRKLLNSIRDYRDELELEVIVVDNASTDDSSAMVTAEFPEVHLLHHDRHEGLAKSNNQAAALAQGRLLLFLNNDTIICPGTLATLVRFLEDHPECSAAAPGLVHPDGKRQSTIRKPLTVSALLHRVKFLSWTGAFRAADRYRKQAHYDLTKSGYVDLLVGAALLVRRCQFMALGGWDEAFEFGLDDVDLATRLSCVGRMYYLADARVIHLGGVSTKLDEYYTFRCIECAHVVYMRKHFGPWTARVYKLLITIDAPIRVSILALAWLSKYLSNDGVRTARNFEKFVVNSQFLARGMMEYWRA